MLKLKKLYYAVFKGIRKNLKFTYMLHGFTMLLIPKCLYRRKRQCLLKKYNSLPPQEKKLIDTRVNYYCALPEPLNINISSYGAELHTHTYRNKQGGSVYFFDSYEYTRYFPQHYHWKIYPGDINYRLPEPAIAKSRLLLSSSANEVLLNLDKVRHFRFIQDPYTWEEKQPKVLFRGECHGKPRRLAFLEKFINNPLFNIGDTCPPHKVKEGCAKSPLDIYDHLQYRYIMALEGNDVASNLKWLMSSNSIAVMPKPTCETWFMEGRLIPNYHYIEIASDYHDLEDKIAYYEAHPEQAKAITANANQWCKQFHNKQQEELISILVLDKYFKALGYSE